MRWLLGAVLVLAGLMAPAAEPDSVLDPVSREQAELEKKLLAEGQPHVHTPAMAEFRRTAQRVEYPSGEYRLPGYLYRPKGEGRAPAVIWNHGSEKDPIAQPELARFYTEHGFVFFVPIRHGHGGAPGPYIGDLQKDASAKGEDEREVYRKIVALHDLYNRDVVAAVAWLKQQPFVDPDRIVMSGVSYGGIQTVLAAERGLGLRAFLSFAPAAMTISNTELQERLKAAVRAARAPLFLLQAENDYSTRPSEILAPLLKAKGPPNQSKVYAAFGSTHQQGHGAFACWSLGISRWGEDALNFIDASMKIAPVAP